MTEEGSRDGVADREGRPPMLVLLESLRVYRHAKVGVGTGVAIAVAAYLVRVFELFGPFAGTRTYPVVGPEAWFLLLAFVLAATSALLVTVALMVRTAILEARALD